MALSQCTRPVWKVPGHVTGLTVLTTAGIFLGQPLHTADSWLVTDLTSYLYVQGIQDAGEFQPEDGVSWFLMTVSGRRRLAEKASEAEGRREDPRKGGLRDPLLLSSLGALGPLILPCFPRPDPGGRRSCFVFISLGLLESR